MTLTELAAYVRDLTGIYSVELVPDALLHRFLNESYQEVCAVTEWPFLRSTAAVTTVGGSTQVSLPSNVGRITRVLAASNNDRRRALDLIDQVSFDELGGPLTVGTPAGYFHDHANNVLHVYPVPDNPEPLTVRYLMDVTDLTASDQPVFAARFHSLLAYRSALKLLRIRNDGSERQEWMLDEYSNLLASMQDWYLISSDEGVDTYGERATGGIPERRLRFHPSEA